MFYLLSQVWGHIGLSIIVMFQFACFDFQNNWVIQTSTVGHTLEVSMKEDCHEESVDCLKGLDIEQVCCRVHECFDKIRVLD